MSETPKSPASAAEKPEPERKAEPEREVELDDEALDAVSGGVRGGDDDLDDLEVERLRRR